jgi:hypothetical protein
MISVDPITGDIKINSKKAPGTYRVKVIGVLPDQFTTIYHVFDIRISTFELSQPSFLIEPQIVEIIEVIAGLSKEI